MINTAISEIFILFIFNFTCVLGYYDKIELFVNTSNRNLIGYCILFSLIGTF